MKKSSMANAISYSSQIYSLPLPHCFYLRQGYIWPPSNKPLLTILFIFFFPTSLQLGYAWESLLACKNISRTLENISGKLFTFLIKGQKWLTLLFVFLSFPALNADMMAGAIAAILQPCGKGQETLALTSLSLKSTAVILSGIIVM